MQSFRPTFRRLVFSVGAVAAVVALTTVSGTSVSHASGKSVTKVDACGDGDIVRSTVKPNTERGVWFSACTRQTTKGSVYGRANIWAAPGAVVKPVTVSVAFCSVSSPRATQCQTVISSVVCNFTKAQLLATENAALTNCPVGKSQAKPGVYYRTFVSASVTGSASKQRIWSPVVRNGVEL